jgi:hypothetical protein
MHDSAPAYSTRSAQDIFNNTYHGRWIGAGGPKAYPSCSPDLNHMAFYLWGQLKPLVHAARVDKEEALCYNIVDACQTIRNYPAIFERMWRSITSRVEARIQFHGGHFEHLL